MSDVLYTNSLYTPAIMELEQAADFIEQYATPTKSGVPVPHAVVAFAAAVADALRKRAEKFREREAGR
jgi:hypothetical protein